MSRREEISSRKIQEEKLFQDHTFDRCKSFTITKKKEKKRLNDQAIGFSQEDVRTCLVVESRYLLTVDARIHVAMYIRHLTNDLSRFELTLLFPLLSSKYH